MKVLSRLLLVLLVLSTCAWAIPSKEKTAKLYVSHFENVLGTSLQFKVSAVSELQADRAETAALAEISRLQKILSGYDKTSEFSKWMQTKDVAVKVSPELFEVLQLFDEWKKQSHSALDAAAQVIGNVWKQAETQQQLPSREILQQAVAEARLTHWVLDAATGTATHTSSAPLMLNSFAKSYIIQKAADAAMSVANVKGVVVNIGGDIVIKGAVEETVQISNPKADAENDLPVALLQLQNKAIATSGNYRRGEWIDGKWYSHIVDPRTGIPAGGIISATVVSPHATDAGALATAFNVLTPEESAAVAASIPGTEYLLVKQNGEQIASEGWSVIAKNIVSAPVVKPAADQWNPEYELVVNLELAQLQGFARRPFVAVWVTDKDKNTLRTIAVWYNKERWLHELRAWYSSNFSKFTGDGGSMTTISSATRSAGKYALKWDGKDDKGNYVKPGRYTINIEAVREHGGYDLLSEEINCSGKPQQASLKGKAELGDVLLDYHKKTAN